MKKLAAIFISSFLFSGPMMFFWQTNSTATNLTVTNRLSAAQFRGVCDASAAAYSGSDDGARIQAAMNDSNCTTVDASSLTGLTTAATITILNNKHLILPCGVFIGGTSANPVIDINNFSTVRGKSRNCTVVSTQSSTNDIIAFHNSTSWSYLSDLAVRSEVARTGGAGIRVSGGHNVIDRVLIYPVFDGITFDVASASGNNTTKDSEISDGTGGLPGKGLGGTWHCGVKVGGVSSGTVSGNTFHHVTISMSTAFTDAGYCIQDGADTTIIEGGSQAVANLGGSDSVALHLETVNGGNQPAINIVTGSVFEGGLTKNSVVIDSGFNTTLSANSIQSGLRGILVNGGSSIRITGNQFHLNQQEGVKVTSNSNVSIIGNHFSESSQQANNSFSDIFFAVGAVNFAVADNIHKDFSSSGSTCKFGVEIATGGSDFYTVTGEVNNSNCVSGTISNGGTGINQKICNANGPCSSGLLSGGSSGDLSAARSANTGVLFMGSNTANFLDFGVINSGKYTFTGGNVVGNFAFASGTANMTTAAITGPNCGTTVTVSATGVNTSDVIAFSDSGAPNATTNGPLVIKAWPTANNVNFAYCVQSGTFTPSAATLNWKVMR